MEDHISAIIDEIIHSHSLLAFFQTHDVDNVMDTAASMAAIRALDSIQSVTWDAVQEESASAPQMLTLLQVIEDGLSENCRLPSSYHGVSSFLRTLIYN